MSSRFRDPAITFSTALVEIQRVGQRSMSDECGWAEYQRLRCDALVPRYDPWRFQKSLRLLRPGRGLVIMQTSDMFHGCCQQRIPPRSSKRRRFSQHLALLVAVCFMKPSRQLVDYQFVPKIVARCIQNRVAVVWNRESNSHSNCLARISQSVLSTLG